MRYQIYHNMDAACSRPFRTGDGLAYGYQGDIFPMDTDPLQAIESVYARHNRDDRPDGLSAPSLSTGDVVVIDGSRWFAVDRVGWTELADVQDAKLLGVTYLMAEAERR